MFSAPCADIRTWTLSHRPQLLGAALTILRAYESAGRPAQGLTQWGSFEAWSTTIRGTLVWAGLPDPASSRRALVEATDTEAQALSNLLHGLLDMFPGGRHITVIEMLRRLHDENNSKLWPVLREAVMELAGDESPRGRGRLLAWKFRHLKGRVIDNLRLTSEKKGKEGLFWRVDILHRGDLDDSCLPLRNFSIEKNVGGKNESNESNESPFENSVENDLNEQNDLPF